jgi:hypothetical protein
MVLADPHDELPDEIDIDIADDVLAIISTKDSTQLQQIDWDDVSAFETGETDEPGEDEMTATFDFLVAHSGRYRMLCTAPDAHILKCCFITRCHHLADTGNRQFLEGERVMV